MCVLPKHCATAVSEEPEFAITGVSPDMLPPPEPAGPVAP